MNCPIEFAQTIRDEPNEHCGFFHGGGLGFKYTSNSPHEIRLNKIHIDYLRNTNYSLAVHNHPGQWSNSHPSNSDIYLMAYYGVPNGIIISPNDLAIFSLKNMELDMFSLAIIGTLFGSNSFNISTKGFNFRLFNRGEESPKLISETFMEISENSIDKSNDLNKGLEYARF